MVVVGKGTFAAGRAGTSAAGTTKNSPAEEGSVGGQGGGEVHQGRHPQVGAYRGGMEQGRLVVGTAIRSNLAEDVPPSENTKPMSLRPQVGPGPRIPWRGEEGTVGRGAATPH